MEPPEEKEEYPEHPPTTTIEATEITTPTCDDDMDSRQSPNPDLEIPSTETTAPEEPSAGSNKREAAWYYNPTGEYPRSLMQPIDEESNK